MVAKTPVETIVVDLSGVTFTDILGLDPLLEARSQLVRNGQRLILRGAPERVTTLLRLWATTTSFALSCSTGGRSRRTYDH